MLGDAAARCAPAASVALLLDRRGTRSCRGPRPRTLKGPLYVGHRSIDTVVKIGGGLLAHEGCSRYRPGRCIADVARERPLLIVPGGGPFADAVRDQDERLRLTDDAAHWMAVLGMDQYAHLIASRMPGRDARVGRGRNVSAMRSGRFPCSRRTRGCAGPIRCRTRGSVTSDSIAAWIARAVGASAARTDQAAGADRRRSRGPLFRAASSGTLGVETIPAHDIETLRPRRAVICTDSRRSADSAAGRLRGTPH